MRYAAERAGDLRVVRAVGIESESELPFAALHQLLLPVLGLADRIPTVQAEAIRSAFALSDDRVADRFLISIAVLTLLSEAAGDEGLICLVDDAHWIDVDLIVAPRFDCEAAQRRSSRPRSHQGDA
jgi:hypothetical protein